MTIKKERLDKLLVEKGLIETREKAKRLIMANQVKVDGKIINKVGTKCDIASEFIIAHAKSRFVSRGGEKLEKALIEFKITVDGKVVLDVGASTGGFTDCLLQNGAKKVFCIDVGYGQLDWNLRQDERVVNIERTNIRHLDEHKFDFLFDLATVDVSFISLEKVFPVLSNLIKNRGEVIALIKPQFEAGKHLVKKGGIVDSPDTHKMVINKLIEKIRKDFQAIDLTFSPIKNTPGNIEYLIYLEKNNEHNSDLIIINPDRVEEVIHSAHKHFQKNID